MTMKSPLDTESPSMIRYAIPAPRRSDTISGALRCAFAAPADEVDFSMLLARIDQADRTHGKA